MEKRHYNIENIKWLNNTQQYINNNQTSSDKSNISDKTNDTIERNQKMRVMRTKILKMMKNKKKRKKQEKNVIIKKIYLKNHSQTEKKLRNFYLISMIS